MLRRTKFGPYLTPRTVYLIDWTQRLNKNLCFATVFGDIGRTSVMNCVNKNNCSFTGTMKFTGQGILFPGGAAGSGELNFGTDSLLVDFGKSADGSHPYSFFFRVNPSTTAVTNPIAKRNDGNTVSAGWEIWLQSTGLLRFAHEGNIGNMLTNGASLGTLNAGVWHNVGITQPGTLTATDTVFYLDGVRAVASGTNGSTTSGSDSAQTLFIGRGTSGISAANSFAGTLDCFYAWSRVLSPDEMQLLNLNPYLPMYSPTDWILAQSQVVAHGNAGGGGGPSKGQQGNKKGGGGGVNINTPFGTQIFNVGNAGLSITANEEML